MHSKIRVLDEQTINQIAAGEVIENPASVVKELVENSLDAGSTEITIEIRGGGRQLIRITDNGCGMTADDAVLCLERHATSKIRELDDLHKLTTMGFRGEAIPSIASISKFTILTCPQGQPDSVGTMVMVDGGKLVSSAPAARTPGTTMEVKSLFFNVPVRKKFQKSPVYDAQDIQKVVTLIALANPHVKFQLVSNEEIVLQSAPGSIKERVNDLLGSMFSEDAVPINIEHPPYQIKGLIGSPFHHRPNRTGQYLFINQRPVQSPMISYAVRDGYGMTLPPNRYPVFVLYVTLPGDELDVNVHPQKREVRLSQEQALKELLIRHIENALKPKEDVFLSTPSADAAPFNYPEFKPAHFIPVTPNLSYTQPFSPKPLQPIQMELPSAPSTTKPHFKVLAQVSSYILVEPVSAKEGLYLVDPQAAQSRIIFDNLVATNLESPLEIQTLLVPYTIDLDNPEAMKLKSSLDDLNQMGIQVREFGPNTFMVDGLPNFLQGSDIPKLLKEIASDMDEHTRCAEMRQDLQRRIALAACRSARKQTENMNIQAAQMMLNQLLRCENPYQSPFGKPTMIHITLDELASKFER